MGHDGLLRNPIPIIKSKKTADLDLRQREMSGACWLAAKKETIKCLPFFFVSFIKSKNVFFIIKQLRKGNAVN